MKCEEIKDTYYCGKYAEKLIRAEERLTTLEEVLKEVIDRQKRANKYESSIKRGEWRSKWSGTISLGLLKHYLKAKIKEAEK